MRISDPFDQSERAQLHAQEGVVFLGEVDALALERARPRAVAIAVELQAERRPGGHAQVAQAELFVDEIEVVMQALTQLRAKEGLAAGLVVPGLLARCHSSHDRSLRRRYASDRIACLVPGRPD